MTRASEESGILPVVIGGNAGAYVLGLECYEAFGNTSICVSNSPVELITRSKVFEHYPIPPAISDEQRLKVLLDIANSHPDREMLVLTNLDSIVGFFAKYRSQLEPHYRIPYPSLQAMQLLADKESFAEICQQQGIASPKTLVADLSEPVDDFSFSAEDLKFPVVAKTASSEAYEKVTFPGKKKIWFIESQNELELLWNNLRTAGFKDKFLVQEYIPGDDTQMRSLTFYIDTSYRPTLRSAARVLLQDPSPDMIGNPIAMITGPAPELWESAESILGVTDYSGFANFDIKVDPRDGTPYFLEVNPRIGRNCYYVNAAGANPMTVMANDLFEHKSAELQTASRKALYTLVPVSLIRREVKDRDLLAQVSQLTRAKRVLNPLENAIETNPKRKIVALLQKYNYYRKFSKHRADLR